MGMLGDMGKYTQYQVANSIPLAAQNDSLVGAGAGLGVGLGAGVAITQAVGQALGSATQAAAAPAAAASVAAAPAGDSPEARLVQLKGLLDKGLIAQGDYDTAKAEILKKLMG